jgi:pilus assembly protein CpaC
MKRSVGRWIGLTLWIAGAFGMRWLAVFAMSVSLPLAQAEREPVRSVTAVGHWSLTGATRVAVEVSGDFAFRTGRLHNPERVYFDILNARPRVDSRPSYAEALEDRLVKRIRVAEKEPGVTRVALDLAEPTDVSASRLVNPSRLMIELRAGATPPIPATAASSLKTAVPPAPPQPNVGPPREVPPTVQADRTAAEPSKAQLAKREPNPDAGPSKTVSAEPPAAPPEVAKAAKRTSAGGSSLVRAIGLQVSRPAIRVFAPEAADPAARELTLAIGRGAVIDCPEGVARISTSNPGAVDAVTASEKEVLFQAKALGQATLVVWSKSGARRAYEVTVEPNLEPLRKLLKETFPDEDIDLRASRESLALVGRASSQAVADRALALVAASVKGAIGNLRVAPPAPEKQILLKVRFAELNRSATAEFGINLLSTGAGGTPGSLSTGQFPSGALGQISGNAPPGSTTFTLSDMLNIFAFRRDLNLAALIRDLQTRGLLQVLAEPNLVATNGKEASFLAGGEFPVPVAQGGAAAGAITVQYREFGIRLTFLPQVTANHTIRLHVKPEVSSIDPSNGVTLSGFRIPALSTRRIETDVELADGQSFVIAGLLDRRVTEGLSRIPGLAHIPIFGALFRSRAQTKTRDELVVVVTPEAAAPSGDPPPLPEMPAPFLGPAKAGEAR